MAQKKKILHCFKRRHCEKTLSRTNSFVFTFSAVVVLPSACILSFLFPSDTDVLVPVLSRSTDVVVVVVNFVVVLKFPIVKQSTTAIASIAPRNLAKNAKRSMTAIAALSFLVPWTSHMVQVRPRQKSSKVRQLNGDGKQDQCFAFQR